MGSPDEPLTPAGRLFLRPELSMIIHCAIGIKHHMTIEAIKEVLKNSLMIKHPRFCSLLVVDNNGFEHWRRTEVDIDRHVIVAEVKDYVKNERNGSLLEDDVERVVNEYIADLSVSTPLSLDKPLWELHVMLELKCVVFRIHHALGDGISLMSMFLSSCRKVGDPEAVPTLITGGGGREGRTGRGWRRVSVEIVRMVLFSLVFCLEFVFRCLWVRDQKTVISGGAGVELWPRKVATAKFLIDDMKIIKKGIADVTINDVLVGVISSGLSRYLDHRALDVLPKGLRLTGVAMVNLRQQPGLQELSEMMKNNSVARWGNKFGMVLLPVYCQKQHINPLEHVKRAKVVIDRKKQSLEAHFSYAVGDLIMSLLGPKVACLLNYRILCNTTFTISNLAGPREEISLAGNPITFLRVNTSSIPQALALHMVSYAGRADMQIVAAKDIVPDPEFLAKCFEDALLEMKEAAVALAK